MRVISSCAYPLEMAEKMEKIVKEGKYPSKNAIITQGIQRILDEVNSQTNKPAQDSAGASQ